MKLAIWFLAWLMFLAPIAGAQELTMERTGRRNPGDSTVVVCFKGYLTSFAVALPGEWRVT